MLGMSLGSDAYRFASSAERLVLLDERLGKGVGAVKERAKLRRAIYYQRGYIPCREDDCTTCHPFVDGENTDDAPYYENLPVEDAVAEKANDVDNMWDEYEWRHIRHIDPPDVVWAGYLSEMREHSGW